MKATDLLAQQHRKVKTIFKKLEQGKGDSEALLHELANDLAAHMVIEHELFYPAVAELDESMICESFEEHALGELALKRLMAADLEDEGFEAKVSAARELIEHHADEEEEVLFPKVEQSIDADRLKALGRQMKERFEEVREEGALAVFPKGAGKTLADAASQKWSRARARSRARAA